MPNRHAKRLLAVTVCSLLALSACSKTVETFAPPADESYPQTLLDDGKTVFLQSCASCHGRDGSGGVGPNLRQVWERLTPEEHLEVVTNGRNLMPGFGGSLSDAEREAVVAYERTGWTNASG